MDYNRSDFPEHLADVHWSPDAKHVLAFQTTQVPERRAHYIESTPGDQLQPRLQSYPYLKPGDPIPTPTPRLFAPRIALRSPFRTLCFPIRGRWSFNAGDPMGAVSGCCTTSVATSDCGCWM
ncbi:MAG UNVERIFIED_CONTAM: DPP IV N-terminal domain-containing protein [Planctomycetaceae bacterium]